MTMHPDDLVQIKPMPETAKSIHLFMMRLAPEYYAREAAAGPIDDIPRDWAEFEEDERQMVEHIGNFPQTLTRQDLIARLSTQLRVCDSQAWQRVSPHELAASVSQTVFSAESKIA